MATECLVALVADRLRLYLKAGAAGPECGGLHGGAHSGGGWGGGSGPGLPYQSQRALHPAQREYEARYSDPVTCLIFPLFYTKLIFLKLGFLLIHSTALRSVVS